MGFAHAEALPVGAEWEYEYNWAGDRILAAKEGPGARLKSAGQRRDLTNRFPAVAAALAKLPAQTAILDGVVRTIDPRQSAVFAGVTGLLAAGVTLIRFIATDLLWFNHEDVRGLPWRIRKQRLRKLVEGTGILFSGPVSVPPGELPAEAGKVGADGIMAKRRDSRYRPYARAGDWVLVPADAPSGPLPLRMAERGWRNAGDLPRADGRNRPPAHPAGGSASSCAARRADTPYLNPSACVW